jgi:uncharacterized membrane protein YphA (DoxX/SURF4 family)
MRHDIQKLAMAILRWSLGVVLILQSLRLAFEPSAAQYFARAGLPFWVGPGLAWSEIAAAVLFLVPLTAVIGACLLMVILLLAALVHVLHGEFDIGALVVYAAAALVSLSYRKNRLQQSYERR